MSSPCAWTTFSTGKNGGKHGIYRFTERDFSSYQYKFVNGGFRRAETFWKILCGAHTGCVVNVPMTYPAEPLNGCMIAGFDAPGSASKGVAYPDDLISEMIAKNGPYRITRDLGNLVRRGANWDLAAAQLLENMEMRYDHTVYLMDKYDWDLFTVVFNETDHAHHYFWKFFDPQHPDYKPKEAEKYGSAILDVYKRMDDITGRFMEKNPEVTVMIVSDHGGGINTRGGELVAEWLERLGLMHRETKSSGAGNILGRGFNRLARSGYHLANKYLSTETKFKLIRLMPSLRSKVEAAVRLGGIDWGRTRAFCDGAQDDIWINLEGRDPMGTVKESEYDELCEYICSELREAVDVITGESIIQDVFRKQDVYNGSYMERAADISFNWKPEGVVSGIKTPGTADPQPAEWSWPADKPTGGHSMDGILIAAGPRIAQGVSLQSASLIDVAPTVLYCFGEEIPEDFDGKVVEAMFEPSQIKEYPPRYGGKAAGAADKSREDVYSEQDASVIEERLKDLGYI